MRPRLSTGLPLRGAGELRRYLQPFDDGDGRTRHPQRHPCQYEYRVGRVWTLGDVGGPLGLSVAMYAEMAPTLALAARAVPACQSQEGPQEGMRALDGGVGALHPAPRREPEHDHDDHQDNDDRDASVHPRESTERNVRWPLVEPEANPPSSTVLLISVGRSTEDDVHSIYPFGVPDLDGDIANRCTAQDQVRLQVSEQGNGL